VVFQVKPINPINHPRRLTRPHPPRHRLHPQLRRSSPRTPRNRRTRNRRDAGERQDREQRVAGEGHAVASNAGGLRLAAPSALRANHRALTRREAGERYREAPVRESTEPGVERGRS
jgi:hypothetical protein